MQDFLRPHLTPKILKQASVSELFALKESTVTVIRSFPNTWGTQRNVRACQYHCPRFLLRIPRKDLTRLLVTPTLRSRTSQDGALSPWSLWGLRSVFRYWGFRFQGGVSFGCLFLQLRIPFLGKPIFEAFKAPGHCGIPVLRKASAFKSCGHGAKLRHQLHPGHVIQCLINYV